MQKISAHLWFDTQGKEAAEFYVSVFGGDSKITSTRKLSDTPSGTIELVTAVLLGQDFNLLCAGPVFTLNPSISFHVVCKTKEEVDALWEKLTEGGKVLMELGEYPFSERYGWVQDKFCVSWQLIYREGVEVTQRIIPALMFTGEVCGRAEEAMNKYVSIFRDSAVNNIARYGEGKEPDAPESISFASFTLEGIQFGAMDSAHEHKFSFNEATSFMVRCKDQEEIDHYWNALTAVPEAEQCGWLKDEFGVSWQIVPIAMDTMMSEGTPEQMARVTQAFLKMKKFNIAELQRVYEGE